MNEKRPIALEAELHEWQQAVLTPFTARLPERKQRFITASGAPVDGLYFPEGSEANAYPEKLGFPGQFPFTRGIYPTMYRGRLWTMRQYAGFGSAEATNQLYRYLLAQGQTGLSVAFDLCTQLGYDSDHDLSQGEVGRVGVAIDTLEDMARLFEGIPLDRVSTSMTINAPAAILLAMYIAVAESQNIPLVKLRGTVQNDILKEYIARGTFIFPPAPSMRLVTDVMAYCAQNMPNWNSISISGYHIRESGSTAAQEIGFTLADAIAYIQAAQQSGIAVETIARQLSFFFAAHNDLFEEVAKFRAARRLWAKIMRDRFGIQEPQSMLLRFHTQTAGCTLTAQQPENNIVRVAIQALAAIAGGTQSLHTNSFDEALALPSQSAATIALRTQQILAHESGVANTVDPFGGSFYVEALTDKIEQEAMAYIRKIDALGGVIPAIEKNYMQREIQNASYAYNFAIENKDRIIVGVNDFTGDGDKRPALLKIDEQMEQNQIERLNAVKARRNVEQVKQNLAALRALASSSENLMPAILAAVKSYCTVGEITQVLREVFGEYQEKVTYF